MSTQPGQLTPDAQDAYTAGQAAYGPSNGPKWTKAGNYADSLTGSDRGRPHIVQAYIAGWDTAKAAQPRLTYWASQIANIQPNADSHTIQLESSNGRTHRLSLTPAQFEKLAAYLLNIEETE